MTQLKIANLRLRYVDLQSHVVRLSNTKNNTSSTVQLTAAATAVLKNAISNPIRPKEIDLVFYGGLGRDDVRRLYQFAKIWGSIKQAIEAND